jgi:hypothetical protein
LHRDMLRCTCITNPDIHIAQHCYLWGRMTVSTTSIHMCVHYVLLHHALLSWASSCLASRPFFLPSPIFPIHSVLLCCNWSIHLSWARLACPFLIIFSTWALASIKLFFLALGALRWLMSWLITILIDSFECGRQWDFGLFFSILIPFRQWSLSPILVHACFQMFYPHITSSNPLLND